MNICISIIVPVYGAEKYLSRCLDSILAQTYTKWECILVDDGSKDRSGAICDEYTMKDGRFRVIHKNNEGVSSARRTGLEASTGDFVIHADSDDYLEPTMLEELCSFQSVSGADCIIFDFFKVTGEKKEWIVQKPHILDSKQVLADIISGHIYASCWNKLINRRVIAKYGANFPKNIDLGEDKCFLTALLKNSISVSYLPKPLYNYDTTINHYSLVRSISRQSIISGVKMVNYLEQLLGTDFSEEITEVKIRLKLRALQSGLFNKGELQKLYCVVNRKIIREVLLFKRHMLEDYALFFTVLGFPRCGRALLNIRA